MSAHRMEMKMQASARFLKEDNKSNEDRRDVYEPDFVPYACHYNPNTLLTKNGELLQTIRITGIAAEIIKGKRSSIRDAVREALAASLPDDNFAVWLHTIRRRQDITPKADFPDAFSSLINSEWCEHSQWHNQFINELYITIVHDGQKVNVLKDPREFFTVLWPPAHRKMRFGFLDKVLARLDNVTEKILAGLENLGAYRLSITEQDGIFHSEIMEFIGKIINLGDTSLAIPVVDLSEYLPSKDVSFGYNVMEVRGVDSRSFGAILTIKEYKDLSPQALDSIMQLPQEFILCQSVDFINAAAVKEQYSQQQHVSELSGDDSLPELSGLKDIFMSDKGRVIDYGQQQLCILLFGNSIAELEKCVSRASSAFSELGIVHFREDMNLEECYWAFLPGNFVFVRRHAPISINRIGGFTSLQNNPTGKNENRWGEAVTIFKTSAATPYFFNFHNGDNGHTAIIGPHGIDKTLLLNFICTQAQKFTPRVLFFDMEQKSEITLRAMGGKYFVTGSTPALATKPMMNPLLLENTEENLGFLLEWAWSLITHGGNAISEEELGVLQQAIISVMNLPKHERSLTKLAELLTSANMHNMASWLSLWFGNGKFASFFDHSNDEIDFSNRITGFDMTGAVEAGCHVPVLLYLVYLSLQKLDGSPTLFVINEAWKLLDNDLFAGKITPLLEILGNSNTVAIIATDNADESCQRRVSAELMKNITTAIYLPNNQADQSYKKGFALSEKEYRLIFRMQAERRHFFIKHGQESVVAEFDMSDIAEAVFGLNTTKRRLDILAQVTKELGHNPEDWLEAYFKICEHELGYGGA